MSNAKGIHLLRVHGATLRKNHISGTDAVVISKRLPKIEFTKASILKGLLPPAVVNSSSVSVYMTKGKAGSQRTHRSPRARRFANTRLPASQLWYYSTRHIDDGND